MAQQGRDPMRERYGDAFDGFGVTKGKYDFATNLAFAKDAPDSEQQKAIDTYNAVIDKYSPDMAALLYAMECVFRQNIEALYPLSDKPEEIVCNYLKHIINTRYKDFK